MQSFTSERQPRKIAMAYMNPEFQTTARIACIDGHVKQYNNYA